MNDAYRPIITEGGKEPDNFVDAFSRQLRELFIIDNHQYIGEDKAKVFATDDFKKYCEQKKDEFVWVHYPWNGQTVKCLKAECRKIRRQSRYSHLLRNRPAKRFIPRGHRLAGSD